MDDYRDLTLKDFMGGGALEFMKNKILQSGAGIAEGRYDAFGTDFENISRISAVLLFLYKYYFRAEVHGVENLPAEGPGIIVSNHAPILPFDASAIFIAALVEPEKPRFTRTIINKAISSIPFASTAIIQGGQIVGCDDNMRRLFENQNLVVVFPTGAEGDVHTIFNKYQLDQFTVGFMEYALRYKTPIIPTCVTGSEESAMTLAKIDSKVLGFKHLPITPIFPWLGLLGLIPFPTKFDIYFEPPVNYFTDRADADAANPAKIRELVDDLHDKIQSMLDAALGK
jgi:1-acyl-sn-glycerol-3-phosphate acyltransferase